MDKTITFLVGLPGSGKTTLGNKMDGYFIDDLSIVGLDKLHDAIKIHSDIVVADVFLCHEKLRQRAVEFFGEHELKWIFFENDPKKCYHNVDVRNDGREVKNFIALLTKHYTIPEGVVPLEIQLGEKNADT